MQKNERDSDRKKFFLRIIRVKIDHGAFDSSNLILPESYNIPRSFSVFYLANGIPVINIKK